MSSDAGLAQFPNSTPEGIVLPFDVGSPYGSVICSVTDTASAAGGIRLPDDVKLASAFSTVRAILAFNSAIPAVTEDVFKADFLILPANKLVHFVPYTPIFRHIALVAGESGKIYIQLWKPWQAAGVAARNEYM